MDPLKASRDALAKRIADPKAKFIPGLTDDLRSVLAAFDELDARTAALAAFVLRVYIGPPVPGRGLSVGLPRAQLQRIADMGVEAAAVLRIAEHGERCTCGDCMRDR